MAFAAITMLASCSKEDSSNTQMATSAKVSLKIVGNGVSVKASSEFSPDNSDNTISEVTVFFVRADGSFDRAPLEATAPFNAQLNDISVTSLLSKVYVVANAVDAVSTGITNLSTLHSKVVDIDNGSDVSTQTAPVLTGNGVGIGGKVYQVGSANAVTYETSGSGAVNLTSVTMSFVPARIRVTVVNSMTNNVPVKITLDEISIINASSQSLLFNASGTLDMTNKAYFWGMADRTTPSFANVPTGMAVKNYYTELYSETEKPFFYVFSNKEASYGGDIQPTIVVLKGTFNSNPIYFPVRFDGRDVLEHIESGKSYDLTINLKGDASTGGGGTDDPTVPVTSSFVQITVTNATWVTSGISKEFN